jgi:hypothetical protein
MMKKYPNVFKNKFNPKKSKIVKNILKNNSKSNNILKYRKHIIKLVVKSHNSFKKQYHYDMYIKDFFLNNPDATFENAVQCWQYKNTIQKSYKYSDSDLIALADY